MNKDFRERIDRLEEAAGKATRGEWAAYASGIGGRCIKNITGEDVIHFPIPMNNGNFIAAANPAMIKEMIGELKSLEEEADWLATRLEERDIADHYERRIELQEMNDKKDWREAACKAVEAQCRSN